MDRNFEFTNASGGSALTVRVVTRTARSEIARIQEDGIIKVRLKSSPEEGANEELLDLLSKALEVDQARMEIVAGEKVRDKVISIEGITPDYLEEKLEPYRQDNDEDDE